MQEYIVMYYDAKEAKNPEEGAAGQQRFMEWLKNLGEAVLNPGTPLGPTVSISSDGSLQGSKKGLTGYSVLLAEDMDSLVEMVKDCPFLKMGSIELAPLMKM